MLADWNSSARNELSSRRGAKNPRHQRIKLLRLVSINHVGQHVLQPDERLDVPELHCLDNPAVEQEAMANPEAIRFLNISARE